MATALTVLNRARLFLNDSGAELYTNTVLIPFLQTANEELSDELLLHGIASQKQSVDTYELDAGETEYDPLPTDFIAPIQVWARIKDSDDDFALLPERQWKSGLADDAEESSQYWYFRNQQLFISESTEDREIRLDYYSVLAELDSAGDAIEINGSVNVLAAKTAELAARDIGQNPVKAAELETRYEKYIDRLLGIKIKNQQGIGVRRKGFRRHRRARIF